MLRTFLAFDISSEQREYFSQLISAGREVYPREIKWVEPENLHFTYLFLGDIYLSDQQVVCDMLERCAGEMPVITISGGQLRWNSIHQPKVVWVEYSLDRLLRGSSKELSRNDKYKEFLKFRKKLMYELSQEMPYLELDSRDFRCHLTLGRVNKSTDSGQLKVDKLAQIFDVLSPANKSLPLVQTQHAASLLEGGGNTGQQAMSIVNCQLSITFDHLTFYQSILTPQGPIYKEIKRIKLSGGK